MRIVSQFLRDQRGSMVSDMAKAAAAIAFLSLIAANWLSHGISLNDRQTMQELASTATKDIKNRLGYDEPMTTGSIGKRAGETRLDPCATPRK